MFFAIDLLIPQHGGRFAIPWVAATRGIRYVSKKDVSQCDIIKLCDEILQMVQSSSSRPRLRLSLSLASRLVNGVVKIYRRQVELGIDDLQAFFFQVRAPAIDSSISLDVPIPRIRRRGRRNIIQLSEELSALPAVPAVDVAEDLLQPIIIDEAELARPPLHQIDPDLITLREELIVQPREETDMEGFGVLEDVEPPAFPDALPQVAVPFLSKTTPSSSEKRKAPGSHGTPPKRRVITQMPELEAPEEHEAEPISEAPPQPEVQVVPELSQSEIQAIHEEPETEAQLDVQPAVVVPELDVESAKRRRRRAVPGWTAKTDINTRKKRFVNINRCLPEARERMDLLAYEDGVPVALVKVTDHDEDLRIYKMLALFMEESQPPEEVEEILTELRTSSRNANSLFRTSSLSLPHPPTTRQGTPVPSVSAVPPVEPVVQPHQMIVQVDVHAPAILEEPVLPSEPPISMEITKRLEVPDKTVKPLAESTGLSLPQIDIDMHPPEITIETVLPPAAETAKLTRAAATGTTSSETKRRLNRDRQKGIRDVVKNWNIEEQGEITIEDVCCKPVNRRNVAVAFSDLLAMHKMGYVVLNNKPDSLELGTIKKGPRITKRN